VAAVICLLSFPITPALAFENETDGFRGIPWGAAPSSVEGLVPDSQTASDFESVARDEGLTLKDFPLESYRRPSDKMEFAEAEMGRISYQFYKGRFARAILAFPDSRYTGVGQSYAQMHDIGSPPPRFYESKKHVDDALKKYFGRPTTQPKFLLKLAVGADRVEYKGAMTTIVADCGADHTKCALTFTSTRIGAELDKDFDATLNAQRAQKKAAEDERKAAEAKQKAKPDF
jgi:hypothetical protein